MIISCLNFCIVFLHSVKYKSKLTVDENFASGAYSVSPFSNDIIAVSIGETLPAARIALYSYHEGNFKATEIQQADAVLPYPIQASQIDDTSIAVAYNFTTLNDMPYGGGRVAVLKRRDGKWEQTFIITNTSANIHRVHATKFKGQTFLLLSTIVGASADPLLKYENSAAEVTAWFEIEENRWEKKVLSRSLHVIHDAIWLNCTSSENELRALATSSEGLVLFIWNRETDKVKSILLTKGFVTADVTNYDGTSSVSVGIDFVVAVGPYHGDCVQIFNLKFSDLCHAAEFSDFEPIRVENVKAFSGGCQGKSLGGHDVQVADFNNDGFLDFAVAFRGDGKPGNPDHSGLWVFECTNNACTEYTEELVTSDGASMLAVGDFTYSNKVSVAYIGWGHLGDNYVYVLEPEDETESKHHHNKLWLLLGLIAIILPTTICFVAHKMGGDKPSSPGYETLVES